MASSNKKWTKKIRIIGKRATIAQKEKILSYMEANPDFANDRFGLEINELKIWEKLAPELNKIGGANKCPRNWKKCWSDMKKYARSLTLPLNAKTTPINGASLPRKPLPLIEQRILSLMSISYEDSAEMEITDSEIEETDVEFNNMETSTNNTLQQNRNSRASELQKLELVQYFEDNPESIRELASGDSKSRQRIWIELAHRLNMLDGTMKTTSKWAKYWSDIIIYTKNRAWSVINKTTKIFHIPRDIDRRILNIIGHNHLLKEWIDNINQLPMYDDSAVNDRKEIEILIDPLFENTQSTASNKSEEYVATEIIPSVPKPKEENRHFYHAKKIRLDDLKNLLDRVIDDDDGITLKDLPETLFAISDALSSLSQLVNRAAVAVTKIKSENN